MLLTPHSLYQTISSSLFPKNTQLGISCHQTVTTHFLSLMQLRSPPLHFLKILAACSLYPLQHCYCYVWESQHPHTETFPNPYLSVSGHPLLHDHTPNSFLLVVSKTFPKHHCQASQFDYQLTPIFYLQQSQQIHGPLSDISTFPHTSPCSQCPSY